MSLIQEEVIEELSAEVEHLKEELKTALTLIAEIDAANQSLVKLSLVLETEQDVLESAQKTLERIGQSYPRDEFFVKEFFPFYADYDEYLLRALARCMYNYSIEVLEE